jgi:phosphatidylserine decarboxylase
LGEKRFLDMTWQILISSFVLSLILLIPLGIKWEIPRRITILGSMIIGILTGVIVWGIAGVYNIKFWQILIHQIFLIIGMPTSLLLWRFFRDPERIPPEDRNTILSPSDGKVIYVKRIEKGRIPYSEKKGRKFSLNDFTQSDVLPSDGYLIGISMNFLNVHVNRAPIDGKISFVKHIKGSYISLKRKEALTQNERALTVIDNGNFKVGIVQIASRLVRKIVLYLREGNEISRGERMGMIRFGSQVDLILPSLPSLHIEIKPGDNVKAGVSIVAKIV